MSRCCTQIHAVKQQGQPMNVARGTITKHDEQQKHKER